MTFTTHSAPNGPAGWQRSVAKAAKGRGFLHPLGQQHWAFLVKGSGTLLVTFETSDQIRANTDYLPWGTRFTDNRGWSHLCVIAEGQTWWRDPAVFAFFDQLVDDEFFEEFDQVVFFGAGASGYAAAAYSVTAPGAEVVLIAPRATLDPERSGWDKRDMAARRICFTDRYGYAPDMTEGAGQVWLIHDPLYPTDAMHAALFHRPWVTRLLARYTAEATREVLEEMRIFDRIIEAAADGNISLTWYNRLWRARRSNASYLKSLLASAEMSGRPQREIMICQSVTRRLRAPRFAQRLAELRG